jgi:hypothetical protein
MMTPQPNRLGAEAGSASDEALDALGLLLSGLPLPARASALRILTARFQSTCVEDGIAPPAWVAEVRAMLDPVWRGGGSMLKPPRRILRQRQKDT